MKNKYQFLDKVNFPSDIKSLKYSELKILAKELREELIDAVSVTGGHLGAGLGVVELTIALHYVFDTPNDKLIWDVGHQTYPHKILTGRKDKIRTLRQGKGLSGFTKRSESEYDPFGAAHSSTSISSALGIAVSMDLDHQIKEIIFRIQNDLFVVGSDLANPDMSNTKIRTTENMVQLLENDIDVFESELSELTNFILPGGTLMSTILHLSRTISRRAETSVIALSQKEQINTIAAVYLNRLSDLLFVLARALNKRKNIDDVVWKH